MFFSITSPVELCMIIFDDRLSRDLTLVTFPQVMSQLANSGMMNTIAYHSSVSAYNQEVTTPNSHSVPHSVPAFSPRQQVFYSQESNTICHTLHQSRMQSRMPNYGSNDRQILGMVVIRVEYNHHQEAKLACRCWRVTQMHGFHI
jgi:hypothetical protein